MARPRQPVDLIKAKGLKNLTKAEYIERKDSEVMVSCDRIKPPQFLTKNEKKQFEMIAKELIEIGIMSNLDCDILARYIKAEKEYLKLTKELEKIKFKVEKEKGEAEQEEQYEKQCEKYAVLVKAQSLQLKACNEMAREMWLNISSKCKLVVTKKEETPKKNKFLSG